MFSFFSSSGFLVKIGGTVKRFLLNNSASEFYFIIYEIKFETQIFCCAVLHLELTTVVHNVFPRTNGLISVVYILRIHQHLGYIKCCSLMFQYCLIFSFSLSFAGMLANGQTN